MPSKEWLADKRKLTQAIRANGFKVAPGGRGGHSKILDAKGQAVVDAGGPLYLPSSPSEVRNRMELVNRLRAAGVITKDPWEKNPDAKTESNGDKQGKRGFTKEMIENAHKVQAQHAKERQRRTNEMRAELEPIVAKIGGWRHGFGPELAKVMMHWGKSRGRVDMWKSEAGALQNVFAVRKGNSISEGLLGFWNAFIDDLKSSGDPAKRYTQLLRESKELPPAPTEGAAVELPRGPVPINGHAEVVPIRPEVGPAAAPIPKLALEAVYQMVVGRADADRDTILTLGEKIAMAELNGR